MTFYFRNDGFGMGFNSGQVIMNIPPIVEMPKIRFLECVRKVCENVKLPSFAYDDFYEDSDFGFFVLKMQRKFTSSTGYDCSYAIADKEQIGKTYMSVINRKVPHNVRVVLLDEKYDLTKMEVKLEARRGGVVFTNEFLNVDAYLNRRLIVQTCLIDVFAKEEMFQRYFPKYITDRYKPEELLGMINRKLSENFDRRIAFNYEKRMKEYKVRTIGQNIYAMLIERERENAGKEKFNNVNIRLLLLSLATIALSNEDDTLAYLAEMYKWLVLRSCDSCLEKVLFAGRSSEEILYNLAAFGGELRPFCMRKVRVAYTIFEHGKEVPVSPYVIKRLGHGFFTISGAYDRAEVTFVISVDYICISRINVGQALMLREVINRVVRAVRATTFGHGDTLLEWFREIFRKTGSFKYIDECINDLVCLLPQMPELANCFKNLVLCLYFAKVPYQVVKTTIAAGTARNFDLVTANLLTSNVVDVGGVIDYLFGKCVNETMVYAFLSSEDRVLPLKALCMV